jgi:mono/diheme cytochrome c family protein
VKPQFAFCGDRVVVRPPIPTPRRSMLVLQIAAVVMLAGFSMAAGWWFMHGRDLPAPVSVAKLEPVKVDGVKPAALAVAPSVQPVERPPPPPLPPTEPKPEKPATPPAKPITPPPPPKPADKPTTTLTFQKDIQPILQGKCVLCHGDKNKFKGGLDVRTVRTLEKGGETGPAINRQEPELSPLWDAVSSGQMPPGKNKLSESEKKKIHDWLVGGGK